MTAQPTTTRLAWPDDDAPPGAWALACASFGLLVHPLHHVTPSGRCSCGNADASHKAGKHPRLRDWQAKATRDAAQIRAWWRGTPDANIGIATGEASGVLVIDCDGADGVDELRALGALPDTFTVSTSGGPGRHLYFQHPEIEGIVISNSVKKIAPHVDVRTQGGNIVGPGSANERGEYRVVCDAPPAPLPDWLLDLLTALGAPTPPPVVGDARLRLAVVNGCPSNADRARAYARKIDPAIAGSGGHAATFAAAMKIACGFDLSEDDAFQVLAEEWNPRCSPPWSVPELRRKVTEASTKGEMLRGALLGDRTRSSRSGKANEKSKHDASAADTKVDDRITIPVAADLDRMLHQANDAIAKHAEIFQRGGALVHIVHAPTTEALFAPGAPIVRPIAAALLRVKLTTVATFTTTNDGDVEPVMPPDSIVHALHQQGGWPSVRPLTGVLESPALRLDGSVIQTRGYDTRTGYLYEPSAEFEAVPESPTQEDARRAREELAEVFCDFPFVDDAARAMPIAALLTMLARPAIRGSVPAFVVEANTRGSGKSLITDAISMIATGRASAKMSWPPDDAELEKILGSYALRGATLINFDNVVAPFGGAPLDRCLTAVDSVELRVLGKSETPALPWLSVVMATGNNVTIKGDTSRRVLVARLESPDENPEDRTGFRHPNLLAWAQANRGRLVRAALTILRAWYVAGKPIGKCRTWGSFEAWAEMVPPALVFAGAVDPMRCRAADAGVEDIGKTALSVILDQWPRLDAGKGLTVRAALALLYARRETGEPDGFDDVREAIESMVTARDGRAPDARKVGDLFRSFRGRNVRGRSLVADGTDRNGVARWRVAT